MTELNCDKCEKLLAEKNNRLAALQFLADTNKKLQNAQDEITELKAKLKTTSGASTVNTANLTNIKGKLGELKDSYEAQIKTLETKKESLINQLKEKDEEINKANLKIAEYVRRYDKYIKLLGCASKDFLEPYRNEENIAKWG